MRNRLLAFTLPLVAMTLATGAAEAANVTSLVPWDAANRYLVTADVDGRVAPRSDPRAKKDYLHKGDWVKITCQATGGSLGGSTLWDRVGPYYVPDAYLKTYTSGPLANAPKCKKPAAPKPPKPTLPDPQGGYGSYSQTYDLTKRFRSWTSKEMTGKLMRDFSRYFPFAGCGKTLTVGQTCRLDAPGPDGPVKVTTIAEDGFALVSLDGHPEGAGRTITFRWARYCSPASDYLYCDYTYLNVDAWGPVSRASLLGPFNAETIARRYWTKFAKAVTDKYPQCPRGKAWVPSRKNCLIIV